MKARHEISFSSAVEVECNNVGVAARYNKEVVLATYFEFGSFLLYTDYK